MTYNLTETQKNLLVSWLSKSRQATLPESFYVDNVTRRSRELFLSETGIIPSPLVSGEQRRWIPVKFLLSEVACQGGSVVAVAEGENLAVSLNKYSVNRGNAVAEWCAYKSAVTERRVQCSVGGIAR